MDLQAAIGQRAQGGAAGLPEQQGRSRVGVHEDDLKRRDVGAIGFHDFAQIVEDDLQALGQRYLCRNHDRAARDIAHARTVDIDHAKAGAAKSGIDAQDAHGVPLPQ